MEKGSHMLTVGEFVLNTSSRKLYNKEKKEVSLPPTLFALLKFFIDHQNQVCSKDMIIDNVWKGKVVVEANVNQNIKKLRDVLGDSAADPKYIETVTGEGFRFVANSEAYRATPQRIDKKKNYNKIILTFIVSMIVVFLVLNLNKKSKTSLIKELHPLTSLRGLELYPIISSDKKYLVFNHKFEGGWDIYLKPIDKELYHPIVNSEDNEFYPVLSKDSSKLIYFVRGPEDCGLYVRSIKLEESSVGEPSLLKTCRHSKERIRAEWINENEIFISVNEDIDLPASIFRFDLITKNQRLISKPDVKGFGDFSMKYSEKFKKLAYIRDIGWSSSEIWIYDLTNSSHKKIKSNSLILSGVDWTDNGWVVYRSGNKEISKIEVESMKEEVLARFSTKIELPFVISNTQIGAVVGEFSVINIGVFNLENLSYSTVINSSSNDYYAAAGEEFLAFVSDRSGDPQIWIKRGVNNFVKLTNFKNTLELSELSVFPGKDLIMFNKSGDINIINSSGDTVFDSADYSNRIHRNPAFDSRNNSFIYAVQYDGEWNIESRRLDSFADRRILFKGISARPCISEDCFYYIRYKDPYLYKYLLNSNTSIRLFELGKISDVNSWDVLDDESIIVKQADNDVNKIMKLNLKTGEKSFFLESSAKEFSLDKSRKLLFTNVISQGNTDLMFYNLRP